MFAAALYDGPLADAVQAADPKLLYPAIQVVSRDAGGMARGKLGSFFDRRLKLEDVIALAPDIKAIETATTQPELRSIPALPGNGVKK